MQLVMFGSPGVGKGTQAKILSGLFNLKHISTGDLLRDQINKKTEVGLIVQEIINKGNLVPDELIGTIVKNEIKIYKDSFILDGFPRTENQINQLNDIFKELQLDNVKYVVFEADKAIIAKRLSSRRSCTNCGHIISLLQMSDLDHCPKCGNKGNFIKRDDDDEEVVMKRLIIFEEATKPVIDYYKANTNMICLDATLPPKTVTDMLIERLKS